MAELPQLTPLGEVWSYNNAGFYLAGRAVEVATGMSYEAAAKELVLDPLGMTMSFFFPAQVMTHRFAVGHIVKNGRPQVARPWPIARAANAAGGLASTARDQLEYARFHMGDGTAPDGTRLLGADLMQRMQTPAVATDGLGTYVGITWMLRDVGGERLVRHGGATHGQLSAFIMVPARRFAITVLTNANRGGELHGEITRWALERYLGLAEPEPEFRDLPPEALREYAGYYTGALSTSDVRLELREGGLVMHSILKGGFPYRDVAPPPAPPPVRVAICGDDTFVALDPPLKDARGEFLRRPDGAIQWLRFGGRIRARHPADVPPPPG
jgi:CubicO group peptidase (beta-lactamase class C family)